MAKVKSQIYDGSEESYTDASGKIHYLGELIRHTLSPAYPLPSLNPTGVVRKSPRGYKPTEQGNGSARQRPWRDCFKLCAEQWDELPDVCPEIGPCPAITSKKNIWDAKKAQGVMCSYFDLFMGCCLSSCTEISVTGPGGVTYSGGVIPDGTDCWPCDSPCKESVLSISYTAKQMLFGEQQSLFAHDSMFGDAVPCCLAEELVWTIISGGGFLNPATGLETTYTAPDSNANCYDNPVIELSDCCGRTGTLTLAISMTSSSEAYYTNNDGEVTRGAIGYCSRTCTYVREWWDCNGVYLRQALFHEPITNYDPNCYNPPNMMGLPCYAASGPGPVDVRDDAAKLAGCCPGELA